MAKMLMWNRMGVRECTVSFIDSRGLRHSTVVYAGSVLEAAALGMKQLRGTGMLDDEAALELTVDVLTRSTHQVPVNRLRMWLDSGGKDPKEAALKAKLR